MNYENAIYMPEKQSGW